jgi:hypothetical protein
MKIADAPTITKAFIDWLDNKYKEKTITTEISVNTSYGTKVVDVVLSNGHAIAYEIKSDLDTTKRLEEQIKGFSEIFEYVYVVYWGERFTLDELNLPENVGAIKAFWSGDNIVFKKTKKAKINRFATPRTIANLLWKDELHYFINKKNIKTKKSYDKLKLSNLFIDNFNKTESIKIFRFVLKKRFERGFLAYKKAKNSISPLKQLTKYKKDMSYISKLQHT